MFRHFSYQIRLRPMLLFVKGYWGNSDGSNAKASNDTCFQFFFWYGISSNFNPFSFLLDCLHFLINHLKNSLMTKSLMHLFKIDE